MNVEDTIVAVSSPPGAAVRGIVRLTGPRSFEIYERLFSEEAPTDASPDAEHDEISISGFPRYVQGAVKMGTRDFPAAAYLFRGPRSYTRQDVVELHLLGAPGLLGRVVESCLAAGARRAEPGEFTARAFLAGALDLSQVHGIAGMIAARSDLQLQAAERLLHGALSETANRARETLADLLSLVEGALDFADEPIEFISPVELRQRLTEVYDALRDTTAAGLRAERWAQLPHVLLVGAPNAGKSSLLNRLTGLDRAICAPIAGTTRDLLSAPLRLDEAECLLIDMAGLEKVIHEVDAKAQEAARRAITNADLILQVIDVTMEGPTEGIDKVVRENVPVIVVGNKIDRVAQDQHTALASQLSAKTGDSVCLTSAVTQEGCEQLKRTIEQRLHDRNVHAGDATIALMAEHRRALQKAIDALQRAIDLAANNEDSLADGDLVAAELRVAADELATLVGKDQTEDLLGRIFSRFCVGK
ncbi:MAG: tRNA modification GTPase [Phycisphaerales bacterium]|nr:tRNA modification GTPase [Phycisphaerales bacterium]